MADDTRNTEAKEGEESVEQGEEDRTKKKDWFGRFSWKKVAITFFALFMIMALRSCASCVESMARYNGDVTGGTGISESSTFHDSNVVKVSTGSLQKLYNDAVKQAKKVRELRVDVLDCQKDYPPEYGESCLESHLRDYEDDLTVKIDDYYTLATAAKEVNKLGDFPPKIGIDENGYIVTVP